MSADRPKDPPAAAPPFPAVPPPLTMLGRLRPRHVIGPLVLFTGACVTGPYPQSVNFLSRAEQVPGGRSLVLPPTQVAYAAWQLPPQSPWAGFSKSTLLAALGDAPRTGELPDVMSLAVVQRAELAALRMAALGFPANTLVVVDLRGAASVAFANMLSHRAGVPLAPVAVAPAAPAEFKIERD